jgi:GxxExxY protein
MGACFEVYNAKGCGFLEPVYYECLAIELEHQRIPATSKPMLTLNYRGRTLLQTYQPDFICFEKIILELKTVSALAVRAHRENSTSKHKRRFLKCLFLIISRPFA